MKGAPRNRGALFVLGSVGFSLLTPKQASVSNPRLPREIVPPVGVKQDRTLIAAEPSIGVSRRVLLGAQAEAYATGVAKPLAGAAC
jgi:hypothetical protein